MVEKAALNEFPSLAKAFRLDLSLDEFSTPQLKLDYIKREIMNNFDIEIGEF